LTGIDVVIGRQVERNVLIYSHHDDTLYVEEVTVWMSSLESTRYSSHPVCQIDSFDGALKLFSSSNWYTANSDKSGWSVMYIRPSEQWEVLPSKRNIIIELKLQALSEGKVFGAICLKMHNCTLYRSSAAQWDPGIIQLFIMPWDPGIITATAWGQAVFRGGGNVMTQERHKMGPPVIKPSSLSQGQEQAQDAVSSIQAQRNTETVGNRESPSSSR
jgi:hypothetical protein